MRGHTPTPPTRRECRTKYEMKQKIWNEAKNASHCNPLRHSPEINMVEEQKRKKTFDKHMKAFLLNALLHVVNQNLLRDFPLLYCK